jgi:hypothetical protein
MTYEQEKEEVSKGFGQGGKEVWVFVRFAVSRVLQALFNCLAVSILLQNCRRSENSE